MRKRALSFQSRYAFLFLCCLVSNTRNAVAAQRMTGEQLEREMATLHGEADAVAARQLFAFEPAAQLDSETLMRCSKLAPGKLSLQALLAFTDKSLFLVAPAGVLTAEAPPDHSAQAKMITMTIAYVTATVRQLPNFFATRVITSFRDSPWYEKPDDAAYPEVLARGFNSHVPLQPAGRYQADIQYRHGLEVVHGQSTALKGLTTSGEFGPVLGTVLLDAAQGRLAWSRWELNGNDRRAVFHFSVAAEKSHFDVGFCCILRGRGEAPYFFHQFTAYDGELTIDPASGAILRVSLKATGLKRSDPIVQARILVEYGPVELGGRTYICPKKGVALSVGLEVRSDDLLTPNAPLQTLLNDVAFEQYHVTRADIRMLPGNEARPSPVPPTPDRP